MSLKDLFEQGDLEKRIFHIISDLENSGDSGIKLANEVRELYELSKRQHYIKVKQIIDTYQDRINQG